MKRVRMTRVELFGGLDPEFPPRTKDIEAFAIKLPKVGKRFTVFGSPLNPEADLRMWSTSPVKGVGWKSETECEFSTCNSFYRLEVLGDA